MKALTLNPMAKADALLFLLLLQTKPALAPCAGIHPGVVRGNNSFTLSWPLPCTNFILESTPGLASTNWQSVVEPMTTNNGCCAVTVPQEPAQYYFRLRKP